MAKGAPVASTTTPLAILVDGHTSSGAELVTGALQEGRLRCRIARVEHEHEHEHEHEMEDLR